jgi:hypothetical protein
LQTDEWQQTGELLESILANAKQPAPVRLRAAVRAFYHSEVAEAPLRRALGDAAPLYRDVAGPEPQRNRALGLISAALQEIAPRLGARRRTFAAELFVSSMVGLGQHVSETQRSAAEVDAWAQATTDMFLAYVRQLAG